MGTRAHWFSSRWRYRRWGGGPTYYVDTLADIREEAPDGSVVERREGRVGDHRYVKYGTVKAGKIQRV